MIAIGWQGAGKTGQCRILLFSGPRTKCSVLQNGTSRRLCKEQSIYSLKARRESLGIVRILVRLKGGCTSVNFHLLQHFLTAMSFLDLTKPPMKSLWFGILMRILL